MKKRFKTKKSLRIAKRILYIIFLLGGFFLSYLFFYNKVRNSISEEDYLNYLLKVGFNRQIDRSYISSSLGLNLVSNINSLDKDKENKETSSSDEPLVYIYNSHDTEEYLSSYFNVYNIKPDVKIASYYLKEKLEDLGIKTIVENQKIKDILNKNKWVYRYSYQAKSYAKVMFLVGLEHDNYEANLKVATTLNEMIKLKYPSISRGIYKKKGPGVNGIYNQDFDSNCILIEVGGQYNSILEVSNTIDVLARILYEYIGE